jgi:hypothetical protein
MHDAVNVAAIPADAGMVAGYIDGNFVTMPEVRRRFPNAVKVEIAVRTSTNAGHVFDTEPGNPEPPAAIRWVAMRRASGFATPTVYAPRSWWQWCRDECGRQGVAEPLWWIAEWNGRAEMIPGAIAHQYADPPICGGDFDLSIVADQWPGIDDGAPSPSHENPGVTGMLLQDRDSKKVWLVGPGHGHHVASGADLDRLRFIGVPYVEGLHALEIVQWAMTFGAWDDQRNDFRV